MKELFIYDEYFERTFATKTRVHRTNKHGLHETKSETDSLFDARWKDVMRLCRLGVVALSNTVFHQESSSCEVLSHIHTGRA